MGHQSKYEPRRWRWRGVPVETRQRVPLRERIPGLTVREFGEIEQAGELIRRMVTR